MAVVFADLGQECHTWAAPWRMLSTPGGRRVHPTGFCANLWWRPLRRVNTEDNTPAVPPPAPGARGPAVPDRGP